MGGRVTGAPFAIPGESRDRGALATTGDIAMGLGWSEDKTHAFVPEGRFQGGGLWADESAGLVQPELGFNYTWLPRRADIGVRAMALGGSGFLIGPERNGSDGDSDPDDAQCR